MRTIKILAVALGLPFVARASAPASFSLEELVSACGEAERYAPCAKEDGGIGFDRKCAPRSGEKNTWDFRVDVRNGGQTARFLRIVCRLDVPYETFDFWNGYQNQPDRRRQICGGITEFFPAIAALSEREATVFGLDPTMLASRVDTQCVRGETRAQLEIAFPVYLEPGRSFVARLASTVCKARYRWHDVVERWWELFPKAYAAAENVHPGVGGTEAMYMYWSPERSGFSNDVERASALKATFGPRPFWEWCYRPYVRGGDWAITDELTVGWRGLSQQRVEEARCRARSRLAGAKAVNCAPMWYLNVTWAERELIEGRFPDVVGAGSERARFWNQDCINHVYGGGDSAYARHFRKSLELIPRSFPDVRGIGWDSCFANLEFPATNAGFAGTEPKSFRKGVPFVLEAVGVAGLLDFNHAQVTGDGYRMANCVNYKLVAPWMIGVRTDCGLYEGTAMQQPKYLWRIESLRARLGPRKVLSWHKMMTAENHKWVEFDHLTADERADVWRQIVDNDLFLSYYWGIAVSARVLGEQVGRLSGALGELVDLIGLGWHASPGVDAPKGVLVARYGEGKLTRLAVINPGFEPRRAELYLPGEYWPQFPKGRRLTVDLPARQVMIVGPDFAKAARPCATLSPVAAKSVLRPTLEEWLSQNRNWLAD